MKEIELFPHNEQAYKKLEEALETTKCTTINHATGTGKSFIALKYLYAHRDKKYLYLAPTYPILEQLKSDCYQLGITPEDLNVDMMIYRNLLPMDMEQLYQKYDGFIFDEYHRVGADETYKRIKQLKLQLQENDDTKKFIGLTATPIRYLDDERNMTQEIFDGNVASSISLAEAMLEELLPVPLYINSKLACREELGRIAKRVGKLEETKEKHELEAKLKELNTRINSGGIGVQEMIRQYITDSSGKYIIFCSTIDALREIDRMVDKWFSSVGPVKKYKVYSGQKDGESKEPRAKKRTSREVNQANLDGFNAEQEGISVLLCVDILNEGVHVKGIDGVLLLRRTVSPIIYFQQIGRALSFSGRHKQIKIFDLVNNFGNHNAIDAVYREVEEEMRRMIALTPQKAEQYQEILDRFKIMDETKSILQELETIKEQVTPQKIIASKINHAIMILEEALDATDGEIDLLNNENLQKAYATIAKYYKYVDNEQFQQLSALNILLPEELSMSYEERLKQLEGYSSIKEREKAEYDLCIDSYIQFILEKGRKPELDTGDIEEKRLSQRYLNCIAYLDKKQKEKLKQFVESQHLELESWEKVLLDQPVYGTDIDHIIMISYTYLNNHQVLPDYIERAILSITYDYTIQQNTELFSILDQSEKIEAEQRKQRQQERIGELSGILDDLMQATSDKDELRKKEIIDGIFKLNSSDRNYIKRQYALAKKKQYQETIGGLETSDLIEFCKKMKTIDSEDIDSYYSMLGQDQDMYATLKGIIEFMVKNGGKLPSKETTNELERTLASKLELYIENGSISPNISDLEEDMQSQWYSPEKIISKVILEKFEESTIKLAILRNINFFYKHGHRALKNSKDEEERTIAIEYEKKCMEKLDQETINMLNRIFNYKKNLQKACEAYIQNIIASQTERES